MVEQVVVFYLGELCLVFTKGFALASVILIAYGSVDHYDYLNTSPWFIFIVHRLKQLEICCLVLI